MKITFNKLAPYIVTILTLVIFNVTVYSYLVFNQNKEYKLLLKGYADSIINILAADLKNASNSSLINKSFFFCKNFKIIPKSKSEINLITITPNIIKIKNLKEEYIFDLHNIKENINKLFPKFIAYGLSINSHNIFTPEVNEKQKVAYNLTKSQLIGLSNDILVLELGIKKDSLLYLDRKYLLQKKILIFAISSFLISTVLLYFYLRVSNKINRKIDILSHELHEEKETNKAFLNNKKADIYLKKLYIKKLTEIYLKKELGEEYDLNSLAFKNQIFPINLSDLALAKTNIENLITLLQEYFAPYFVKIGLRITNSIKEIEINCSTEVFYQIIFSLVFNLIEFIDRQSNIPQILKIDFKADRITVSNEIFPLDERKMIKLSEIITDENADVFILNCSKIFKSLQEHKFKYNIFSRGKSHIIEIIYPLVSKSSISKEKRGEIVDFTKYLDKKL